MLPVEKLLIESRKTVIQILDYYRENNIYDIPVRDFYKKKLKTHEAYLAWEQWMYKHKELPDKLNHLTELEQKAFIQNEKNKWKFGIWIKDSTWNKERPMQGLVQVLTGTQYFFLTQIKPHTDTGIKAPNYLRKQAQIFDIIESLYHNPFFDENPRMNKEGLLVAKRRRIGFTLMKMSFNLRNILLEEGYRSIGHSHNEMVTREYYTEYSYLYDRIKEWAKFKDEKGNILKETYENKMKIVIRHYDKENKCIKPFENYVLLHTPIPKNFNSLKGNFYDGDEYGEIKYNLVSLFEKTVGCLKGNMGNIIGLFIIGGTAGQMGKNSLRYKDMLKSPKIYGGYTIFLGAQHCNEVNPDTGFDDEQLALKKYAERKRELIESGDIEKLELLYTEFPTNIDECFYVTGNVTFNTTLFNTRVNQIEEDIEKKELVVQRGYFKFNPEKPSIPKWEPDSFGNWYILQHPSEHVYQYNMPPLHYIAGSDNYSMRVDLQKQKKHTNKVELSQLVEFIGSVSEKRIIAWYEFRSNEPKEDYLQSLYGCMYYNCKLLAEVNNPGQKMFFQDYENGYFPRGYFVKYLCKTPKRFGSDYRNSMYGIHVGTNKFNLISEYLIPYVNTLEAVEKIDCAPLLLSLCKWDLTDLLSNSDHGMAFLMLCIAFESFAPMNKGIDENEDNDDVSQRNELIESRKKITQNNFKTYEIDFGGNLVRK